MKKALLSISLFFLPAVAFAQAANIEGLVVKITDVINKAIVPLIFAIAFVVFIWGIFWYFIARNEEGKVQGRDLMIWGLVAFFVMISVWGLVNILVGTFELDGQQNVTFPQVPSGSI